MIRQAIGRIGRRLKRSPRWGSIVMRIEEAIKDGALRANAPRRRRLLVEWDACTTPEHVLDFSIKYLSPGQQPREILEFARFARSAAPQVFCEIGTLRGGTHLFLTHAIPSIDVTIAVDRQLQNKGMLSLLEKRGQRSFFLAGSSQSPDTGRRLARILGDAPLDLLFIDGDHSYTSVRSDFLMYREFVRHGGLIAFHDVCEDYQTRFGRQTGHFAGGVPALWTKLRPCYEHREFIDSPDQDAFGIGVIVHSKTDPLPMDL
jgi:predicted O-methyltransferase YrrM